MPAGIALAFQQYEESMKQPGEQCFMANARFWIKTAHI